MISLSWQTTYLELERPQSSLVTLHRYKCIYPETCVRSAISSVCYYVVLIEISVIAWWSHGMTISALLAFDFVRRIKRSPLESVHKQWPMLMSARTSQNGGDRKRLNCNRWHGTASVLAPVPLSIFRSNSKFDENSERSSFEYTRPITTIFCTRHDSVTVVTCAKYRCYRPRIFYTRVFWIFIEFRIRSKYA